MRSLVFILFTSLASAQHTAEQKPLFQQQQVDVGYGYQQLNQGLGDWRDVDFSWLGTFASNDSLYLSSRTLHHFGLEDRNYQLGGYLRLASRTSLQLEVAQSELQLLLPKSSWLIDLSQSLSHGWVAGVAVKQSRFDLLSGDERQSQLLRLGIEKYLGDYRWVLQHYIANEDSGSTRSNALQLHRYFADRHSLFVSISSGSELDFSSQTGLIPIDVSTLSFGGTYWYDERWALYTTLEHNQVSTDNFAYRRDGLYLGLRHFF